MICKNNSIFNVISPEKGFCFHTLLTFQLYLCKNQHSFSTCCMDPLFICQEDCSRNSICFLSDLIVTLLISIPSIKIFPESIL